ncbi:MAG: hypothetical protein JWQ87_7 [Candidatus Sulfotelmatobacter sp.]|nr:hypothetical protein [Candidatus Sulfotelmatobacter sp.]
MAEAIKFLFSSKEAAYSLAVSARTIENLKKRGDLETKRIGKRVLITRESLRRYAAGNHPEATKGSTL